MKNNEQRTNLEELVDSSISEAKKNSNDPKIITLHFYYADGVKPAGKFDTYEEDGFEIYKYVTKKFTIDEFKKLTEAYLPEEDITTFSNIEIDVSPLTEYEGVRLGRDDLSGTLSESDRADYNQLFGLFQLKL